MKRLTATEAARGFANVLDAVEREGQSFAVVRHGREVARIGPAAATSGRRLKDLLAEHRPDEEWARELSELRGGLTQALDRWSE